MEIARVRMRIEDEKKEEKEKAKEEKKAEYWTRKRKPLMNMKELIMLMMLMETFCI
jgi:hypothetical protein